MGKGQSLIIQFVLFFLIGLSVFLIIGNFFKYQNDVFRDAISVSSLKAMNSYISSMAVLLSSGCDSDFSSVTVSLGNTSLGRPFDVVLEKDMLVLISGNENYSSTIYNLLSTYDGSGVAKSGTITITLNKMNNKLSVSG